MTNRLTWQIMANQYVAPLVNRSQELPIAKREGKWTVANWHEMATFAIKSPQLR